MFVSVSPIPVDRASTIREDLTRFSAFGTTTRVEALAVSDGTSVPLLTNEFWTARQRAAHSLHEVSYRACFKPLLPRFFIERLCEPGDLVYDPFMGRGTTLVEAMLLGRRVAGCDVNPLCRALVEPRLNPPSLASVAGRLEEIPLTWDGEVWDELEVFYHPRTLRELTALRAYLLGREAAGALDESDRWIRMVALNRLTGHSAGFFSVYTLPPNQAVSLQSQRRINARRRQKPEYRDVRRLILRKSRQLLADGLPLTARPVREPPLLWTKSCASTPELADAAVDLVVTSPPFLDVVDYVTDNWLRGWFCGIDTRNVPVWQLRKLEDWTAAMAQVLAELRRVLRRGGWLAFEVGEVHKGTLRLEQHVLDLGVRAGFTPELVMIHEQEFTKTANCWGVDNATKGTNTNRIVLLRNPG